MQIFVKLSRKTTITLNIMDTDTIEKVKDKARLWQQPLAHAGKQLQDDRTLSATT